jgi:pyruvate ferredoxin oxidoreductase gamma subunit
MFQVRIHGRGGQGVVTAAEILSIAAFLEGKNAQAFPTFGSERMGAPVTAFCRIDDKAIRLREPVVTPDALIIQDATLLHGVAIFDGLAKAGYVLINSPKPFAELDLGSARAALQEEHCTTLPATKLALEFVGRPIPNAALLGGFAAMTGLLKIDSVAEAIMTKFPRIVGEKNVAAARAAYQLVKEGTKVHAQAS